MCDGELLYHDPGGGPPRQVVRDPANRVTVLRSAHDDGEGGHRSLARTTATLAAHFYWRTIERDVTRFCQVRYSYRAALS